MRHSGPYIEVPPSLKSYLRQFAVPEDSGRPRYPKPQTLSPKSSPTISQELNAFASNKVMRRSVRFATLVPLGPILRAIAKVADGGDWECCQPQETCTPAGCQS